MNRERWLALLSKKVRPLALAATGLGLLLGGYGLHRWLEARAQDFQAALTTLNPLLDQTHIVLNHYQSLADLKSHDVDQLKNGMSTLAQSKKVLFESGLSLQEERRLLEKQLEIMTTYLNVDPAVERIFLMRGDQPLESYFLNYIPLKAFNVMSTNLPRVVRIVSKERFANPERGSSEVINGKLQWEPPQVGTSVRSNALGEYVLFTNSRLILHGPPRNPVDHEAYPHICLGLSLEAARNLYHHSFIGTKILLVGASVESVGGFFISPSTLTLHGN